MNAFLHRFGRPAPGFTLVEIMFALAIGSLIMASALTSYIFSVKGFGSLSNYNQLQAEGRRALDWFALDLRGSLALASCTSNRLVAILPQAVDSRGQVTASNLVTHSYQNGKWYRIGGDGTTKVLAGDVSQMTFRAYDAAGNPTTQPAQAVSVQVNGLLAMNVGSQIQSSDVISARLRMRNTK